MTTKNTSSADCNTLLCFHEGCPKAGVFRAPKSMQEPHVYLWFCLEHVREYNAKWNYFAGCSSEEVEREIRRASLWERPTWPFGKGPLTQNAQKKKQKSHDAQTLPIAVQNALGCFELPLSATLSTIKMRYRKLVKELHPDTNGGSPMKIEKFYKVQQAFATLRNYYATKAKHENNFENGKTNEPPYDSDCA